MNPATEQILADLTEPQRQAVTHIDGPLLVLAGAGSGKTRVITRRVAYLMARGVAGGSILAVTFTNKAANEMKQRIDTLLAGREQDDWASRPTVSTFHSFAARILRIHHDKAGLPADYSIYDQSDRLRAIRLAIGRLGLSEDNFQPANIESIISREKNRLSDAADFAARADGWLAKQQGRIFAAYEQVLAEADALDFDDLLLRLARLLGDEAFREQMSRRYRYILIDEYQDINKAQYRIARDLARPANNICATGDPDQSIYGWRGADLDNILRFEKDFPGATVVRLEQNYRSTQRILAAADALIRHNRRRKHKGLWTHNPVGEKIALVRCTDPEAEAAQVADRVEQAFAAGVGYGEMAVFMRLNALTRVLEEEFVRRTIPFQIARGVAFYNRKEIKDATAYLRLLVNPADRVSLERVINTPARGIGKTSLERLGEYAAAERISLWEACLRARSGASAELTGALGRSAAAVGRFADLMERLKSETADRTGVARIVELVLNQSGLAEMYAKDESAGENLSELITAVEKYDQDAQFEGTLGDFLARVALVSDIDSVDEGLGAVTLMTLHAAKGLEFPLVFVVGCEEGLIPHYRQDKASDVEEERRLFFVGITRAKRQLVLTHVADRMLHGKTVSPMPSPFLAELPADVLAEEDLAEGYSVPPASSRPGWGRAFGRDQPGGYYRRRGELGRADQPDEDPFSRQLTREDLRALRQAEQEALAARCAWPVGTLVRHATFGVGKVVKIARSGPYTKATIDFRHGGLKAVMMEIAPIEKIGG